MQTSTVLPSTLVFPLPPTSVEKLTGLSTPNANALIQSLATLGLLKEVTGQKRNRRYICAPYWALFSEDEDSPQDA